MQKAVRAEDLTEELMRKNPVWMLCNGDEAGETLVQPVTKLPIHSAGSCLIGCQLRLADGSLLYGFLGNLSLNQHEKNQHFLTLSVFIDGTIKHLERYFDFGYAEHGPSWLANLVGKKTEEIFPIAYDISSLATGADNCVHGIIPSEPKSKLSRSQLIQMSIG